MQQIPWTAAACIGNSLRVWVHEGGQVTPLRADIGAGSVEVVLVQLVAEFLRDDAVMPVICTLPDVGLVPVPAAPPTVLTPLGSVDPRIVLLGLANLSQVRPADLMGAQGAQVAGFIAVYPDWDGVLCLTGPHSKWVHVSAGEVVSFQTYLTGEMFDLLAERSILHGAVDGAGWDDAAFAGALSDAMSRPERVAAALFPLHAEAGLDPATARACLSGMLIGMEMAAARPYWLGQNIALIGEGEGVGHYEAALRSQGVPVQCHDAGEMALRGLQQAYAAQRGV